MKMRKQFFSESGKKPSHSKPNGFTSKFFEAFWSELKNPLLLFCKSCFFVWRIKHFSKTSTD